MGITIDVAINGRPIKSYGIENIETNYDSGINTYHIIDMPLEYNQPSDWAKARKSAVKFSHHYGDPIDIIILEGLAALVASQNNLVIEVDPH